MEAKILTKEGYGWVNIKFKYVKKTQLGLGILFSEIQMNEPNYFD